MIIWVRGVEDFDENVRVEVLRVMVGMYVKVKALDNDKKFIIRLSDIIAIEFSDKLIVKFKFQGCFPPREF